MLVIDISINRELRVDSVGAVRIKPKEGQPEIGQMCTYYYGPINEAGRVDEIGKTEFPYGSAVKLSHHILGLFLEQEDK
jgi:hypothetical protein